MVDASLKPLRKLSATSLSSLNATFLEGGGLRRAPHLALWSDEDVMGVIECGIREANIVSKSH